MKISIVIFIVLVSFAVLSLQSPQKGDAGSGCDLSKMKPDMLKNMIGKFADMAKNGGSQFTDMIKQFATMFGQG
ncbi:unnamed protein product [Chironomus riparius]|uniref:Uncharacterized protein n=1 Tax=Chironomus riparius TaxID=315576 RepID=A0A9N9RR34_9DIPT|nr:unnamed protein product [Chironomus riparius]